ncbi:hypothetical protein Adt_26697 [Abeliophyllum distichum]|uniref:Uncharacterized protein n=1 Tax=Abeliophyllum distichum TaxID=126358 RepID=A0ABD1RSR2_9LAMI
MEFLLATIFGVQHPSHLGIGSSTTSFSNFRDSLLLPSLSHLEIGSSAASFSNFGDSLLLPPSLSHLEIGSSVASFSNFGDSLLLPSLYHLEIGSFVASFSKLQRSLSTTSTTSDFSPTSSSALHINERSRPCGTKSPNYESATV